MTCGSWPSHAKSRVIFLMYYYAPILCGLRDAVRLESAGAGIQLKLPVGSSFSSGQMVFRVRHQLTALFTQRQRTSHPGLPHPTCKQSHVMRMLDVFFFLLSFMCTLGYRTPRSTNFTIYTCCMRLIWYLSKCRTTPMAVMPLLCDVREGWL